VQHTKVDRYTVTRANDRGVYPDSIGAVTREVDRSRSFALGVYPDLSRSSRDDVGRGVPVAFTGKPDLSGRSHARMSGSESVSEYPTNRELLHSWTQARLSVLIRRTTDNFRLARDPGTIPKGAANRLRRRSLPGAVGYTAKRFLAIATVRQRAFS